MTWQERLQQRREELLGGCEYLELLATAENRAPTDEEGTHVDEALREVDEIDQRLEQDDERRERRERAAEADRSPNNRQERAPARTQNETRTYHARGNHSFFADAFRASRLMDFPAQDRLRAHMREVEVEGQQLREDPERRDVTTAAFGSLVVPQFLLDEFAPVLRNGRAFLNACRQLPLPAQGMTLTIPRGQTGSAVEPQATQNTEAQETDVDFDDDLTVPVRTFAGQQDVARQALERGTPDLDRLLYQDLVADYAERLDSSALNDDGTAGTHKGVRSATGINAVTYTDATPTVQEAWPKLADAVQRIGGGRKLPANLIIVHSRRWGWVISALDGNGRPLIVHGNQSDAVNAMGKASENFGEGQLIGTLQGLVTLVDNNIPTGVGAGTNEDVIVVVRREDCILWEEGDGLPRELRFEETNAGKLMVKLLVYGYSAFTAERYPQAKSVISGTGLVAPTF